ADRSKVLRMREQNGPVIADPLMKVNRALRCICGKVWSHIVDSECHDRYAFRGFTPRSNFISDWANKRKPTQLKALGGFCVFLEVFAPIRSLTPSLGYSNSSTSRSCWASSSSLQIFCTAASLASIKQVGLTAVY